MRGFPVTGHGIIGYDRGHFKNCFSERTLILPYFSSKYLSQCFTCSRVSGFVECLGPKKSPSCLLP